MVSPLFATKNVGTRWYLKLTVTDRHQSKLKNRIGHKSTLLAKDSAAVKAEKYNCARNIFSSNDSEFVKALKVNCVADSATSIRLTCCLQISKRQRVKS